MVAIARPSFELWKMEMGEFCLKKTGCTWDDLCGDEEPLCSAYYDGLTPLEFIDREIERHDLEDLTKQTGFGF